MSFGLTQSVQVYWASSSEIQWQEAIVEIEREQTNEKKYLGVSENKLEEEPNFQKNWVQL